MANEDMDLTPQQRMQLLSLFRDPDQSRIAAEILSSINNELTLLGHEQSDVGYVLAEACARFCIAAAKEGKTFDLCDAVHKVAKDWIEAFFILRNAEAEKG